MNLIYKVNNYIIILFLTPIYNPILEDNSYSDLLL